MKTDEITFVRGRGTLDIKGAEGLTYGQTLTLALLLDRYSSTAHVGESHSITELCDYAAGQYPSQKAVIRTLKNHLNDPEAVYG